MFTSPVGTYKANAFGLHDMHGNVWEWCRDWYRKDYSTAGKLETKGRYSGALRVVRGGSWLSPPDRCRSAFRTASDPTGSYCDFIVGFRVVVDAPRAKGSEEAGTSARDGCYESSGADRLIAFRTASAVVSAATRTVSIRTPRAR